MARKRPNRARLAAWAVACLCLGATAARAEPAPAVTAPPSPVPERVLFLGNTLIYAGGELQAYTHEIAAAGTPPLHLDGGFRSAHLTDVGLDAYPIDALLAPGRLGVKEPFQLLVLAGSSRDALSDAGRAQYRKTVTEFDTAARKQGGRVALFWVPEPVPPYPLAGKGLFEGTRDMTLSVANDLGAIVLPVGLAYREAYRQRPGVKLQDEGGNQPTAAGEYLAGCVVYASLYGRSPVGNAYAPPALDADTRAFLQDVAWQTTQTFFGRGQTPAR